MNGFNGAMVRTINGNRKVLKESKRIKAMIFDDTTSNWSALHRCVDCFFPDVNMVGPVSELHILVFEARRRNVDLIFLSSTMLQRHSNFDFHLFFETYGVPLIFICDSSRDVIKFFDYDPYGVVFSHYGEQKIYKVINRALEKMVLHGLVQPVLKDGVGNKQIIVSSGDTLRVFKFADIVCCEEELTKCRFYMTNGETFLAHESLGFYERLLPSGTFLRVHGNHIINIEHIHVLHTYRGNYCELKNHMKMPVSVEKMNMLLKQIHI